jgi:hypothetical protein
MARRWASAGVLRAIFNLCFIALFLQVLAFAEWIFAMSITWQSPIAHQVPYFAFVLAVQAVALVFYLRRPWVAVIAAWVAVAVILARVIPWGSPGWVLVLHRYQFELVFVVLAHVGLWVFILMNRAEAREIEEATGVASGPGEGQS